MFKHFLIPVDGSPSGDNAAEWGLLLARRLAARVGFVHVHSGNARPGGEETPSDTDVAGLALLEAWKQTALAKGLATTARSIEGPNVAATITEEASSEGCDLIVMGTQRAGWLTRFLAGRTAEEVLRLTPVPLLLVRHEPRHSVRPQRFQRVLAPVDGSVISLQTLVWAEELARQLEAELLVFHAHANNQTAQGQAILDEALSRVSYRQTRGLLEAAGTVSVRETVVRVANQQSDLVVMGTHARGGLSQVLLGSVAEQVARHASVPVLLLPPAVLSR